MSNQVDTVNATVSVVSSNSTDAVSALLDTIITKHNAWTVGTRKASQQELYSVLAECLELMMAVKAQRSYAALNSKLIELGFTFNNGTSLQTRIVRAVFKHDRRNLARYAAIIKIAMDSEVKPEGFAAWLNANGSIDAVRQSRNKASSSAISSTELYQAATNHLRGAASLATVSSKLLANISEPPTSGYVVSIARINSAGDYEVVGASTDSTAVRRALLSWGQHVVDKELSIAIEDEAKASNQKLAKSMAA